MLLVAGIADMAVSGLSTVVGGLRGLMRRADMAELAAEGQQEIKARGRLALDRFTASSPAHLEVLAQQVKAHRGPAGV
ncbi:polyprenyl synthetase [Streptomyces sp. ISL-96]|nr:polyprenyl synthetase [Streptomyces sp. ISL-96]